jgi:hypothetical protein
MRTVGPTSGQSLILGIVPVVAVVVIGAIAWRVYLDASNRLARGVPVMFRIGALHIDTPLGWAIACLFCCVVFVPIYLSLTSNDR